MLLLESFFQGSHEMVTLSSLKLCFICHTDPHCIGKFFILKGNILITQAGLILIKWNIPINTICEFILEIALCENGFSAALESISNWSWVQAER